MSEHVPTAWGVTIRLPDGNRWAFKSATAEVTHGGVLNVIGRDGKSLPIGFAPTEWKRFVHSRNADIEETLCADPNKEPTLSSPDGISQRETGAAHYKNWLCEDGVTRELTDAAKAQLKELTGKWVMGGRHAGPVVMAQGGTVPLSEFPKDTDALPLRGWTSAGYRFDGNGAGGRG